MKLVRRADRDRQKYRTPKTLLRFRMEGGSTPDGAKRYQELLPEKGSIVDLVDQALRERFMSAAEIGVQLVTSTADSDFLLVDGLSHSDAYVLGRKKIEESDGVQLRAEIVEIGSFTSHVFLLDVKVRLDPTSDQGIFDRWPDTQQEELLQFIRQRVQVGLVDLDLFIECNVAIWSSAVQRWRSNQASPVSAPNGPT